MRKAQNSSKTATVTGYSSIINALFNSYRVTIAQTSILIIISNNSTRTLVIGFDISIINAVTHNNILCVVCMEASNNSTNTACSLNVRVVCTIFYCCCITYLTRNISSDYTASCLGTQIILV